VENYLAKERGGEEQTELLDPSGQAIRRKAPLHSERERRRDEAEKRQRRYRKLKPLQDALDRLEEEIAGGERRKKDLEAALADRRTYEDGQQARSLTREYGELTAHLKTLYDGWTALHEEMERTEPEEKGDG
jgi:ATP-binding cassette subfamily F protein 3